MVIVFPLIRAICGIMMLMPGLAVAGAAAAQMAAPPLFDLISDTTDWRVADTPYLFNGQVLQPLDSLTTSRQVFIRDAASFHITAATTLTLEGAVANQAGSWQGLNKTGHGTLALGAENTYRGATMLYQGTLHLKTNLSTGAGLRTLFAQAGTQLQLEPGVMLHDSIQVGSLPAYPGIPLESGPNPLGAAMRWVVNSGVATHSGSLMGDTPVSKHGAGTLRLQGLATAYTGTLDVVAGTLEVNTFVTGAVAVHRGARLTGNGTVGKLTVGDGGVFAPGMGVPGLSNQSGGYPGHHAPGFSIQGNLALHPGATLQVVAHADGTATHVTVDGTAQLGGTLHIVPAAGDWAAATRYVLISADRIADGSSFDQIRTDSQVLQASVEYDPRQVVLWLRQPSGSPVPAPETTPWMASSHGAALRARLLDDSRLLRLAMLRHYLATDDAATAWESSFAATPPQGTLRTVAAQQGATATWGQFLAFHGRNDGRAGLPGDSRHLAGILLGSDITLAPGWLAGGVLGAHHADWTGDHGAATARIRAWHAGVSLHRQDQDWFLTLGAAVSGLRSQGRTVGGLQTVDGNTVTVPAARDTAHAWTRQLFLQTGRVARQAGWQWTPFMRLAWVQHRTPSYVQDAQGGQIVMHGTRDNLFELEGGVRVAGVTPLRRAPGQLGWHAEVSLRHAAQGESRFTGAWQGSVDGVFRQGAGTALGLARTVARLSLGLGYQVGERTWIGLNADMQAGQRAWDVGGGLVGRWVFV